VVPGPLPPSRTAAYVGGFTDDPSDVVLSGEVTVVISVVVSSPVVAVAVAVELPDDEVVAVDEEGEEEGEEDVVDPGSSHRVIDG
jgi:hypothetical protein